MKYYVQPPLSCQGAIHLTAECRSQRFVTAGDAAAYLGGLLVLGVVLSAWSFRRRDIP